MSYRLRSHGVLQLPRRGWAVSRVRMMFLQNRMKVKQKEGPQRDSRAKKTQRTA